jgi:8-oxo-dGTP diphosphatase
MTKIDQYLATKPLLTKAVVGLIHRDNQVLLGLRKKVSNNLGQSIIAGIGGKLDGEETNEQALVRELHEEINVTVTGYSDVGKAIFLFPDQPKWNQDVEVYLIDSWIGEPQETEVIKPTWYNINQLPTTQMWEDNIYWIYNALNKKHFEAIFMFDKDSHVIESRMH